MPVIKRDAVRPLGPFLLLLVASCAVKDDGLADGVPSPATTGAPQSASAPDATASPPRDASALALAAPDAGWAAGSGGSAAGTGGGASAVDPPASQTVGTPSADAGPGPPTTSDSKDAGAIASTDVASVAPTTPPTSQPDNGSAPPDVGATPNPPPTAGPDAGVALDNRRELRCPADPNLRLCVRFEGAVIDESPQRLQLSVAQVSLAPGPTGQAGRFQPTSRVSVQGFADLPGAREALTLEAWVNPTAPPASGARALIVGINGAGIYLEATGELSCTVGATTLSSGRLQPGVFRSVACTTDGAQVALWLDGGQIARAPASSGGLGDGIGGPVTPVRSGGPREENLAGLLDNLRVFRGVRSKEQICAAAIDCR